MKFPGKEEIKDYLGSGLVGAGQTIAAVGLFAAAVGTCVFLGGAIGVVLCGAAGLMTGAGFVAGAGPAVLGVATVGAVSTALALGSFKIIDLLQPLRKRFEMKSGSYAPKPNSHFRPAAFAAGVAASAALCAFGVSGLFNARAAQGAECPQKPAASLCLHSGAFLPAVVTAK